MSEILIHCKLDILRQFTTRKEVEVDDNTASAKCRLTSCVLDSSVTSFDDSVLLELPIIKYTTPNDL